MIVLFTDFGAKGPYVGEVSAVVHTEAPGVAVVDLMNDAPAFDAKSSAYLLAALAPQFAQDTVFVCVVDPGVGSDRHGGCLLADGRWFVGPDNGLLALVARRSKAVRWWQLPPAPPSVSVSFHGRDLFAPLAAQIASRLAVGAAVEVTGTECPVPTHPDWPDDLARVIYVDGYGNAVTGLRAQTLAATHCFVVRGQNITRARVFSDVAPGQAFWYENSNGLAEIAINQGRADQKLGLEVGMDLKNHQKK